MTICKSCGGEYINYGYMKHTNEGFCCVKCKIKYRRPKQRLKKIVGNWFWEQSLKTIERKHPLKPWKDPDSLFCDTDFLEKLFKKNIKKGGECV